MAAPAPAFVGLSGAIASGKSEALAALERLGARTLSTDAVAHELLDSEEARGRLVGRWGESVVAPDGHVDRERVAEIVFRNPDELGWLESVLHPLVGGHVLAWRERLGDAELGVVEVPLLFESGMEPFFDATLVVVAGDERRSRWAAERGTGELEGRSSRQLSEEEKAARATFVVRNDGALTDLEKSLRELWPRLVAAGGER